MDSLKSGDKGTYRAKRGCGIISFDFSKANTLHVSRFFQELARCLQEALRSDISLLLIEISGFRDRQALKHLSNDDVRRSFHYAEASFKMFGRTRIPLLGSIRGFICGPLLETLLFLDFPVISRSTRLSSLMLEKSYMPRMGMLTLLSDCIGKQELFRFILTGMDFMSSDPVLNSIAYRIVDDASIDKEVSSLCERFVDTNRHSVRLIKELSSHVRNLTSAHADILERYSFALCFSEPDFKEKIDLFFNKKCNG